MSVHCHLDVCAGKLLAPADVWNYNALVDSEHNAAKIISVLYLGRNPLNGSQCHWRAGMWLYHRKLFTQA